MSYRAHHSLGARAPGSWDLRATEIGMSRGSRVGAGSRAVETQHSEPTCSNRMQPDLSIAEIKGACCKFRCELQPERIRQNSKRSQRMRVGAEEGLGKRPITNVWMRRDPQILVFWRLIKYLKYY